MFVGTGRAVINPEIGHSLSGYGDYPNTGVHDDISVTALFLDDGSRKALLLSFDLLALVRTTQDRFRAAVSAATGVADENVFIACTHVHSAPNVIESHFRDNPACRKDYLDRLGAWAVDAAVAATKNAEECQFRYNYTDAAENMNRRYNFPDRRFLYLPDNKQLLGQSREFVDRELGMVAFRKTGTRNAYKAVITNYTSHPLCVGNSSNLVTADFQGVLRRRVEETFAGCTCLTTTGAAGDNHPLMPESGFATAEEMGTRLGRQVICRCYDSVAADYDEQLRLAQPEIVLKFKDDATRQMLPEQQARQQPLRQGEMTTRVSLLGVGPILLAGFPGEPVAELGVMLKWSSPFLKSYVMFTANDCLGYFPTVNQFYWGGYEPDSTLFVRGTGEQLVAKILEAAHELIGRQPLTLPALDVAVFDGHAR